MQLHLSEAAREYLAGKGYDPALGARPLRRVVQSEVEDALSEGLLAGRFGKNDQILIDIQDGQLVFCPEQAAVQDPSPEGEPRQTPEVVLT